MFHEIWSCRARNQNRIYWLYAETKAKLGGGLNFHFRRTFQKRGAEESQAGLEGSPSPTFRWRRGCRRSTASAQCSVSDGGVASWDVTLR